MTMNIRYFHFVFSTGQNLLTQDGLVSTECKSQQLLKKTNNKKKTGLEYRLHTEFKSLSADE